MAKGTICSREERIAEIEQKIAAHQQYIDKVKTIADAKIAAFQQSIDKIKAERDKKVSTRTKWIEKLQADEERLLKTKSRTINSEIKSTLNKALEKGMTLEEIREKLGFSKEE